MFIRDSIGNLWSEMDDCFLRGLECESCVYSDTDYDPHDLDSQLEDTDYMYLMQ